MHSLNTQSNVRRPLTFAGFACSRTPYILILAFLAGVGQVCFAQTDEAIKSTAISVLHRYHATQDPHYSMAVARLTDVQTALDELKTAVTAAQTARPGQFASEFESCLKVMARAMRRANLAFREKDVVQSGSIDVLLSTDPTENGLPTVISACITVLHAKLGSDSAIAAAAEKLRKMLEAIESEMQQIDQAAAKKKAAAEYRRLATRDGKPKSCESIDFTGEEYIVRSVSVDDPFMFLSWVKMRVERVKAQIEALVKDQKFRYETAVAQALEIIEKERFLPEISDASLQFTLETVGVENCADHKLDLIYRIYSTQILPVLSGTPEARVTERQTPQDTAGLTKGDSSSFLPLRLMPTAGYDSTDKLFAGGRLELRPRQFRTLHVDSFTLEGEGSDDLRTVSAALTGSADFEGWLAHAEWRLNYSNYSLPTGAGNLDRGHLSAQFSGMTKPFAGGNFIARLGGSLEGGNQQSDLHNVRIPSDTLADTGYGALKLYLGLDSRLPHNVFSLSYGLALGSVGSAARVDWLKQVGDIKHEFWYPLGDHRILSLESRFTFGGIQVLQKIPLPERFFGGNNEQFFIADDTWKIRANPVIRAIPGSRFFQTADGAGGDRFFSYTLTAAYAVWHKSLMPAELLKNPDFRDQFEGSIKTVKSTLQNQFAAQDPHFKNIVQQLPSVQTELENLVASVIAAQTARPGQFTAKFKACLRAANTAIRRAKSAAQSDDGTQYGLVQALLKISVEQDENWLEKVNAACVVALNTALGNDTAIGTPATNLDRLHTVMEHDFAEIDQTKTKAQTEEIMAFPQRTLKTIFNEVNIYSVSPVFLFDIAKIGPEKAGLGGLRYGPGAGLRLELASTVHFTIGYAWNVRQRPGEGHGTAFFVIGVRDLFH